MPIFLCLRHYNLFASGMLCATNHKVFTAPQGMVVRYQCDEMYNGTPTASCGDDGMYMVSGKGILGLPHLSKFARKGSTKCQQISTDYHVREHDNKPIINQ